MEADEGVELDAPSEWEEPTLEAAGNNRGE